LIGMKSGPDPGVDVFKPGKSPGCSSGKISLRFFS
jgi:hypothetical protein